MARPAPAGRPPRRKRFGQHFLHDPAVIDRIVTALDPHSGEHLVEIGPGRGALTQRLLGRSDCTLDAIEIDRDLAAALRERFTVAHGALHVGDALEFDFTALARARGGALRIVGNLPYNISTPLLFHLARFADRVRDLHFLLQKEVVDRMVARPSTPAYGRLSVMLQVRFAMAKLFEVGPGAFRPPPKVDSALVRLVPLAQAPDGDAGLLEKIVREAFSARRKTLRNALPLAPGDYAALGIEPGLRPENLAPADYVRIARRLSGARAR